jgi:hypothetical protein
MSDIERASTDYSNTAVWRRRSAIQLNASRPAR